MLALPTWLWSGLSWVQGGVRIPLTVRVYSFAPGWLQHQLAGFRGKSLAKGTGGGTLGCSRPNSRVLKAVCPPTARRLSWILNLGDHPAPALPSRHLEEGFLGGPGNEMCHDRGFSVPS